MSKNNKQGKEAFDEYYFKIYGPSWDEIRNSLINVQDEEKVSQCGLKNAFYISLSSYFVSKTVPVEEGYNFLDMCSSPGGKDLNILLRLNGTGLAVLNDRSKERSIRLKNNILSSLDEKYTKNIKFTSFDASSWCLYEKDKYDSILVDVPCSSESHVINDEKYLSLWTESRPKRLKKEQFAILSSAFLAVKKGGYIMYSTCSINPDENEENIKRLFNKHKNELEEVPIKAPIGEKKEYGYLVLPDKDKTGPMFYSLLRKKDE